MIIKKSRVNVKKYGININNTGSFILPVWNNYNLKNAVSSFNLDEIVSSFSTSLTFSFINV